jgi:hypothetical protein
MSHEQSLGLVFWVLVTYPLWSPRCRRIRRNRRVSHARAEAYASRDPAAVEAAARHRDLMTQADPNWEQDAPYPEVFEQEDDL